MPSRYLDESLAILGGSRLPASPRSLSAPASPYLSRSLDILGGSGLPDDDEPSLFSKGLGAITSVLGAPKAATDYLARKSASALGIPEREGETVGQMLRAGVGLDPSEADSYAGRAAGKLTEFAGDLLDPTLPVSFGGGTAGRIAAGALGTVMGAGALQEGARTLDTLSKEGFTPESAEDALGTVLGAGGAALLGRQALKRPLGAPKAVPETVAPEAQPFAVTGSEYARPDLDFDFPSDPMAAFGRSPASRTAPAVRLPEPGPAVPPEPAASPVRTADAREAGLIADRIPAESFDQLRARLRLYERRLMLDSADTVRQELTRRSGAAPVEPAALDVTPEPPPAEIVAPEPRYAYRARDMGEEGIPNATHSQASLSEDDVRRIAPSRSEGPQEIVRFDLNALDPSKYEVIERPGAPSWVRLIDPLEEGAIERLGDLTPADRAAASKTDLLPEPQAQAIHGIADRALVDPSAAQLMGERIGLTPDQIIKGADDIKKDGQREFSPEAVAIKRATLQALEPAVPEPARVGAIAEVGTDSPVINREVNLTPESADATQPIFHPDLTQPLPPESRPRAKEFQLPEPGNVKPATIFQPETRVPEGSISAKAAEGIPAQVEAIRNAGVKDFPLVGREAQRLISESAPKAEARVSVPAKRGRVTELPKDELGEPIIPGQEDWAPERRAAVRGAAEMYAREAADLIKGERPRPAHPIVGLTPGGQPTMTGVFEGMRSGLHGTPLEGLGSPKEILTALKKDKGNALERRVLEAVDGDIRAEELESGLRESRSEDASFDFGENAPKYSVRPSPGQRGLEGIAEDVAPARAKKSQPTQGEMFGGEMLQGVKSRTTEGREADGALFSQEANARQRAEQAAQKTLVNPAQEASQKTADLAAEFGLKPSDKVPGHFFGKIEGRSGKVDVSLRRLDRGRADGGTDHGFRVTVVSEGAPGRSANYWTDGEARTALTKEIADAKKRLGLTFEQFRATEGGEASGVNLETVRRAFPAGQVVATKSGAWDVTLPGNRRVAVRIADDGIEYNADAFRSGYGREKGGAEQIVGSWQKIDQGGIIKLAKEGGEGTLRHEVFHSAMDLALSPSERASVLKRYGSEEAAAEAYANWTPATTNSWFSKILALAKRLYRSFRPNWETAFERTHSGEAFGKSVETTPAEPKYATRSAKPPVPPPAVQPPPPSTPRGQAPQGGQPRKPQTEALREIPEKPTLPDMFIEGWKSGLVSSPGSLLVANPGSNIAEAGFRAGEAGVAGWVDQILTSIYGGPRTRFSGEALAQVKGGLSKLPQAGAALADGLKNVLRSEGAIPGKAGGIIRVPLQLLEVGDRVTAEPNRGAAIAALAHRQARKQLPKASSAEVAALEKRLTENPTPEMLTAAEKEVRDRQFKSDDNPDSLIKKLVKFRSEHKWMHGVFPFLETPVRIADLTLQRSPAGFVKAAKAYSAYRKAVKLGSDPALIERLKGEAVDRITRPLVGSVILGTFGVLAKSGLMTGSGPSDSRQKGLLKETGWQPYSFKIPNGKGGFTYVPFNRFEPASGLLGFAADLAEAGNAKDANDVFEKALASVTQNLTSKTYLQGLADAAGLIKDPSQFAGQYASNMAGSLVPGVVAKAAQAIDPTIRDTRPEESGFVGLPERMGKSVMSRIPGVSQMLPERRSGTGEAIKRPGEGVAGALSRFASPVQVTSSKAGKELEELLVKLEAVPSAPRNEITANGRKVRLTQEEIKAIQDNDQKATDYLRTIVRTPRFRAMSEEDQKKTIEQTYSRFRSQGRKRVLTSSSFRRRAREATA